MTQARGEAVAPAGLPVVAAAGGRGRNLSGLENPEFSPTIPGDDEAAARVGVLVRYGTDALFGRALTRGVMQAAARRVTSRPAPSVGGSVDNGRQLRNRADAARRLPDGDPWTTGLRDEDSTPTTVQLAAWSMASADLYGAGYTPIVPASIARELWRGGGADRELMERVHRAGGVAE